MNVIYQESITDKIRSLVERAEVNERKIERIELTAGEWQQLMHESEKLVNCSLAASHNPATGEQRQACRLFGVLVVHHNSDRPPAGAEE